MAKTIKKNIKLFMKELKEFSKIISLEKNPVINGKPHKDRFVTPNTIPSIGELKLKEPINRLSCLLLVLWIIKPAHINKADLNKACIIKWKNANNSCPKPRIINIKPSCLSVDRATTFLRSVSKLALHPAIIIVNRPNSRAIFSKVLDFIKGANRIIRKTPAVTKVEEWTKAETGVGAAIAAGSHAENGICALFVKALKIIKKITTESILLKRTKL